MATLQAQTTFSNQWDRPPYGVNPQDHALFLDFDGTLIDIADRPDEVTIPDGLADDLRRIDAAFDGRLVILTGRSVAEIDAFLPGFNGKIIGLHGAEERINGSTRTLIDPIANKTALADAARAFCETHNGLLFEDKPSGFAIHYRLRPDQKDAAAALLHDLVGDRQGVQIECAKMAFEVKPSGTDKGRALTRMMHDAGWNNTPPIHIGDDKADDIAFCAAERLGGFGIRVGALARPAWFALPDPSSVREWLREIIT